MEKTSTLIVLVLLAIGSLFQSCKGSKTTPKTEPLTTPIASNTNSLLWKIEGNGIQSSYLFGTIHLLPQKDFFLSEPVKEAFETSEQIILEIDMDDPNMQTEMMQYAVMKDGQSLDQLLSAEDYKTIDEYAKKNIGMSLEPFKTWQPLLLTSLFAPTLIDGTPASYERTFVQMATAAKKEILGLETIKDQLDAASAIPLKEQAQLMLEYVQEPAKNKALFEKMVQLYKEQKVDELLTYIIEQSGGDEFAASMIDQRNQNWIPQIGTFAKDKSTFFAVGSGHLGGEMGVLNLLKKAGYTVTPVCKNSFYH